MTKPGLLAVAAAIAFGTAAGYVGYRNYTTQDSIKREVASIIADASVASVGAESGDGLKVPEVLPDIRLAGLDGQMHELKDFGRRPLIVNFWATWCEPCRREMPLLRALRQEYAPDRLEVVGIAIDFHDSVVEFLEKTPLPYPQLIGEEDGMEAARAFGMGGVLPFSVFVDEQDRIVALKVGELHRDEAEEILGTMRQLRAGDISLSAAQTTIADRLKTLAIERSRQRG
jgi:thiol-disulfide isomerase/thioredoxin